MHAVYTGRNYTLFTSYAFIPWPELIWISRIFSHKGGFHLLANMFALWTFGEYVHKNLGREEFLSLYLISGMVAALSSHSYRVLVKQAKYAIPSS